VYFFTGDEHFFHTKILAYSNRPFPSIEEMDEALISNHNEVVKPGDAVIHAGDFTMLGNRKEVQKKYVDRLNGTHIFIRGSHDRWLPRHFPTIWERKIDDMFIVVCHYAMRSWARSHYNSWQLHGHHHGHLGPIGKQWDVGVDNNNYYPVSLDQIIEIMKDRPNNLDYERIRDERLRIG